MKKILLLLLCCALMLSTIACSQTQPEKTEAPTDTTTEATIPVEETTEATEPEETTEVTEPEETEPVETTEATEQDLMELVNPKGKPLSEEEIAPFRELLKFSQDETRWYNMATTHVFDSPESVDLYLLFYAMPKDHYELTAAEEEFLAYTRLCTNLPSYAEKYGGHPLECAIINASVVDSVLQQYFGVSLEQHEKRGLAAVYWDETNCYYRIMSDALAGNPDIKAIYQRNSVDVYSGNVDVCYDIYYTSDPYGYLYMESGEFLPVEVREKVLCFCLTLKETDEGYQIVSNTRLYRPEEPKEEVWTPQ